MKYTRNAYRVMLKMARRWSDWRSRLALGRMALAFLANVVPMLIASLVPWYNPRNVKDPAWVTQWTDAYENLPDDYIPLLDTAHPDIPTQFT